MWRARFCFVLRGAIPGPNLIIFLLMIVYAPKDVPFFNGLECLLQILACDLFLWVNGGFPIKLSWDEHL